MRIKCIRLISVLLLLMVSGVVSAQNADGRSPQKGDWSFGVSFNPATLAYKVKMQPEPGDFAGAFIGSQATEKKQMFVLSQDPLAALRVRYFVSDKWAFRTTIGINGSHIDYREYVQDDLAKALNPISENKVVDGIISNLNSMSVAVGMQYVEGKGPLKFVLGFNVVYAIAGSEQSFYYGNAMTAMNQVPSSMPMTSPLAPPSEDPTFYDYEKALGIDYARPLEKYTMGHTRGLGVSADMGIEWFMTERMSLSAAMTFTPVMYLWQPQTYSIYEGFSSITSKVEKYNSLVSPGSHALLYGTENIGLNISLNYFFK